MTQYGNQKVSGVFRYSSGSIFYFFHYNIMFDDCKYRERPDKTKIHETFRENNLCIFTKNSELNLSKYTESIRKAGKIKILY